MTHVAFLRSFRLLALVAALGALMACSTCDTETQAAQTQASQMQAGQMQTDNAQNKATAGSGQNGQNGSAAGKPESEKEACAPYHRRRLPEIPSSILRWIF